MKRARVLLADSSTLLMEAITKLLEQEFEVLTAVRGVWLRPSYLSPFVSGSNSVPGPLVPGQSRRKSPLRLTPRQREVLQLLVAGRSMKEVAFALQIKTRTVAYHKYRMMDDFNLGSNAALVRFALRERVA